MNWQRHNQQCAAVTHDSSSVGGTAVAVRLPSMRALANDGDRC